MLTAIALAFLMWWQMPTQSGKFVTPMHSQADIPVDPYPGATDVPATGGGSTPISSTMTCPSGYQLTGHTSCSSNVCVGDRFSCDQPYTCPDTEHWQLNSNIAGTVHWCHHVPTLEK